MKMPGRMIFALLQSIFRKPATVLYPFVKVEMRDGFRGRLKFDYSKCIGCKLCMKDCPTAAINIRKVGEKQFEADIDLSRCIYCAQCVDSCPRSALAATREFELASLDRQSLRTTFENERKNQPPAEKKADPETPKPQTAQPSIEVKPQGEPSKQA